MEYIKIFGQILGVIIQCATVITLIYALTRFLGKSNHSQNERLDKLEKHVEEIDTRLDKGERHFDTIDDGSKITQRALLALIDHAIDNNHVEKLVEVKDDLQTYLIDK